jgi:hypothetical protein
MMDNCFSKNGKKYGNFSKNGGGVAERRLSQW